MIKSGTLRFMFLLVAVSLISLNAFHHPEKPVNKDQSLSETIIATVDTLQILVDAYCQAKSSIFSVKKQLIAVGKEIEQFNDTLKRSKTALQNYQRTIVRIKLLPNSPYRFYGDTLRQLITKFDSLNVVSKKQMDSLQNDLLTRTSAFDSLLHKVKIVAQKIHGGIRLNVCGVHYLFYVPDLNREEIRMHLFKKDSQNFYSLGAVREYLEEKGMEALMITNAGMYTPGYEPQGLYIEEGSKIRYPLDREKKNTDENFYLYPNGVFFMDTNNVPRIRPTETYVRLLKFHRIMPKMATQSGPMLVVNYVIHPKFTEGSKNEKIRSGVGKINDRKIVFAATTNESNFYDFASFFKDIFGCREALFLDGAISKMYLKSQSPDVTGGSFGPIISVSKKK
jgi:uncharacterized protein YigE (DUF2233 family)